MMLHYISHTSAKILYFIFYFHDGHSVYDDNVRMTNVIKMPYYYLFHHFHLLFSVNYNFVFSRFVHANWKNYAYNVQRSYDMCPQL